jgi:COP9 signalosome complex subunit 6
LGIQSGREVEIFNSYELQFTIQSDGSIRIHEEYFVTKQEQCKLHTRDACLTKLTARQEQSSGLKLLTRIVILLPLVRQVFPSYDFLGWYTVGRKPSMIDIDVLQQVTLFFFSVAGHCYRSSWLRS